MRFQLFESRLPRDFDAAGPLGLLRARFYRVFALAFNVVLLPLAIHWIATGNQVMGAADLLLLLIVNVNFFQARRDEPYPISFPVMIFCLSSVLTLSVYFTGFEGALWLYPISAVMYFVAPRAQAHVYILVCTLPLMVLLERNESLGHALRFGFTIGLTALFGALMSTSIAELQQRLVSLSSTDPLTGALNRRQMTERLHQRMTQPSKGGATAAVLMIDIDHFKDVNDTYGHDSGDAVLQALVNTLQASVRTSDAVFRMGGEEFLVLLHCVNPAFVATVAEKLRGAAGSVPIPGCNQTISVSIGGAVLTEISDVPGWLKLADQRLYQAKERGRDRVVCCDDADYSTNSI